MLSRLLVATLVVSGSVAHAGDDPNACDVPGEAPDVIVAEIFQATRWGALGGITAFSLGTISCNPGSCRAEWDASTNQHPVVTQNMFRLEDGRFEQIGQSWLKHGTFALSDDDCSPDCVPGDGTYLGVECSDAYTAFLNGTQNQLGPKFEVNPTTGVHPHPVTDVDETGDLTFKRLQVHTDDLDPAQNVGASYFVESQYVAADDAAAGNDDNNASYRPVTVGGGAGNFSFVFSGPTVRERSAIHAWAAADAAVDLVEVDVPGDGRFLVAARAIDIGAGIWSYEYAVQNYNSERAAVSFAVTVGAASVSNVGFHDVDYHSGEPTDGTDWSSSAGDGRYTWTTVPFSVNPDANALHWATLYNFRFDADRPPVTGDVTIGLFKPGSPNTVVLQTTIPAPCNSDSTCDPGEQCLCPGDCPGPGADGDGDTVGVCIDCNDLDPANWAAPDDVRDLRLDKTGGTTAVLTWDPPLQPGGTTPVYETLRSPAPDRFSGGGVVCLADPLAADTTSDDTQNPFPGRLFSYVVRAASGCPEGRGSIGAGSDGVPRIGQVCP